MIDPLLTLAYVALPAMVTLVAFVGVKLSDRTTPPETAATLPHSSNTRVGSSFQFDAPDDQSSLRIGATATGASADTVSWWPRATTIRAATSVAISEGNNSKLDKPAEVSPTMFVLDLLEKERSLHHEPAARVFFEALGRGLADQVGNIAAAVVKEEAGASPPKAE